MREILIVGIGGFLGSALRFKAGGLIVHHTAGWKFPLSTFLVNLAGCFLIGLLSGLVEKHHLVGGDGRLFLITGLLGGFTTFSAFGLETFYLVKTSAWQIALLNILLSVTVCILAVFVGERLGSLS